jgi:hypothetical protein
LQDKDEIPMTQLALFPETPSMPQAAEPDIVDALLAAHGGDARVVIEELLADADFLRDQLHTASCLMSVGMGRGWRPKYERLTPR